MLTKLPSMTEMFIPSPTQKTRDRQDCQHDDVADHFHNLELLAAQRGDQHQRNKSAGNMPVRSSSSANRTMPIVPTVVIGFHFGGSTPSTCVPGAARDEPTIGAEHHSRRSARIIAVAINWNQSPARATSQGDVPERREKWTAGMKRTAATADRNPHRFLFPTSGRLEQRHQGDDAAQHEHDAGELVGHVARSHADRRSQRQVVARNRGPSRRRR